MNTAFHNSGILTKNHENSKLHEQTVYAKIWFRVMKTDNEIKSSSISPNISTGDVEPVQERLDELGQTVQAEYRANQKLLDSVASELGTTPKETNEIVDSIVASAVVDGAASKKEAATAAAVVEVGRSGDQPRTAEQLDVIATGDPEGFKAIVDAANQVGVDTDEVARELREREGRLNAAGITKELLEMAERAEAQEPGYVFYNPQKLTERRDRILEAVKKLDSDDWADVKNVAKVLNTCSDAATSLRAGNMTIVADMFDDALRDFLLNAPAGVLHEMDSSEDMEESRVIRQFVHSVLEGTQDLKVENAQVIARAAGYENVSDFFNKSTGGVEDTSGIGRFLMAHPELRVLAGYPTGSPENIADKMNLMREQDEFTIDLLMRQMGLPAELVRDIDRGMKGRCLKKTEHETDVEEYSENHMKELTTITKMVAHFGVDRILKIHNEIGIVNFGKRSIDSLEKLEKIIDNDEDALREIRDKEIIVSLEDALNDDIGSFALTESLFRGGDNGYHMPFEVSSLKEDGEEIGRYIDFLEKRDLHPSVVVIAGHGQPGGIHIGDGMLFMRDVTEDLKKYHIDDPYVDLSNPSDEAVVNKLFRTMKPDADGSCHLILKSCSQGSKETKTGRSTAQVLADRMHANAPEGSTSRVYSSELPSNMWRNYKDGQLFYVGEKATVITVASDGKIVESKEEIIDPRALRRGDRAEMKADV